MGEERASVDTARRAVGPPAQTRRRAAGLKTDRESIAAQASAAQVIAVASLRGVCLQSNLDSLSFLFLVLFLSFFSFSFSFFLAVRLWRSPTPALRARLAELLYNCSQRQER